VGDFKLVPIGKAHIVPVVEVHMRAFPGFFLTLLGPRFLRLFYRSFVDEKTGISWVAVDLRTGRILGAVVGTDSPSGFYRKLATRRWGRFGFAALGAVTRNPSVLKRLIRGLAYRGDPPREEGYALLSSIAVDPESQGRGVGKALLDRWADEAARRSCRGGYLVTDALDNDAVIRFYEQSGWTRDRTFTTAEGRQMHRYVLHFRRHGR
jgi:ribosomal protein S18 acetylase RimI-like enzyme